MEPWPPHCTEPAIRRAFAQIRWEAQREKSYVPPILFIRFFWQKKTWRSKCENSVLQMFHYAACIANFKCYHTDSLIVRNSRTFFLFLVLNILPDLVSCWHAGAHGALTPHPSPCILNLTLHPASWTFTLTQAAHPASFIFTLYSHPHPGGSQTIKLSGKGKYWCKTWYSSYCFIGKQ